MARGSPPSPGDGMHGTRTLGRVLKGHDASPRRACRSLPHQLGCCGCRLAGKATVPDCMRPHAQSASPGATEMNPSRLAHWPGAGLLARGQAHLHPIACSVFPGEPAPSTSIPEKTALDGLTVQSCDIQQTKEQGFLFLTSYHHLGTGPPGLPPPSDGGSCLQTVRANTCSRWVPATPCSPHGVGGLGSCTAEGLGTCPREPQVLGLCVPLGTTLHPPHQVLSGGTEHVL